MMTTITSKDKVLNKALEIIQSIPEGISYSDLSKKLVDVFPDIPYKTIQRYFYNIDIRIPSKVYKPTKMLFRAISYLNEKEETAVDVKPREKETKEEDFYSPFSEWLTKEMGECTKAIPLGGNKFKDKWGTPDVIGIWEPRKSDIIKPPTQIISAEIKSDSSQLIIAFGQACAYKLFSHKTYIVIPADSSKEDIDRLDALCLIFGIGLVLFDRKNAKDPDFTIRVRPSKLDPDMFYVNRFMKLIEQDLFE